MPTRHGGGWLVILEVNTAAIVLLAHCVTGINAFMVATTSLYITCKLALMLPTHEETQQIMWEKGAPMEIHL